MEVKNILRLINRDKLQYLLFMSILHIAVMYNKHMQKYNILPHNLLMMFIWEISISLSLQFVVVIYGESFFVWIIFINIIIDNANISQNKRQTIAVVSSTVWSFAIVSKVFGN